MSDKNETIADIVAEMRQGFDQSWHDIDREWAYGLADRIEAAAKREMSKMASKNVADFGQFGNAAKLREAVEATILRECGNCNLAIRPEGFKGELLDGSISPEQFLTKKHCSRACYMDKAFAALAEPPRNCDVGTAEDKVERFGEYCISHKATLPIPDRCRRCRIRGEMHVHKCIFEWGQMPYEEGGAK